MTYFPAGMIPPPVSMDTVGFWEAAREHRLVIQRCARCRARQHPPAPVCHACRERDLGWEEVEPRGRVYTWTAVHKAWVPQLEGHLPYLVAVIELEAGVRIVSNLVEIATEDVRIGTRVEAVWDDYAELSVPRFRPVSE